MYAIIDVAGQQFKVEKGQKIFVHLLDEKEGDTVDFEDVLLIDNDGKISIGEPLIKSAFVEGQILEHQKGDKVIVFKKKRRKGYKVRNGHRQQFSHIEILSINETGAGKKIKEKPVAAKATPKTKAAASKTKDDKVVKAEKTKATKAVAKKPAARKTTTAAKKPATKTAAVKSESKKPAAKKPAVAKKTESGAKKATTAKTKAAPKAAKPKAAPKKDASKGDSK